MACLIILLIRTTLQFWTFFTRFLLPDSMFHGYCSQLYWLTSFALLWFPPVGFNQYPNMLRRVKLHTLSTISLISSWTLLKTFYVAINFTTLHLPMPCKIKLIVYSWYFTWGYTLRFCWLGLIPDVYVTYLNLFPSNLIFPWQTHLALEHTFLKYLTLYLGVHTNYVLLNQSYACSLVFLSKEIS
jgi:hypothetical protein